MENIIFMILYTISIMARKSYLEATMLVQKNSYLLNDDSALCKWSTNCLLLVSNITM